MSHIIVEALLARGNVQLARDVEVLVAERDAALAEAWREHLLNDTLRTRLQELAGERNAALRKST